MLPATRMETPTSLPRSPRLRGRSEDRAFSGYFAGIAASVGQENQTATNNHTTQQSVVTQAQSLQQQISGVSLDDQATDLMQYQKAYQAVASLITTINTLAELAAGDHAAGGHRLARSSMDFTISASAQQYLADLNRTQSQINQAQAQVSSGLKVQQASDDPAAISEILQLQTTLAQNQQIQSNLSGVSTELSTADSSLQSAIQAVQSAIALGEEGASTTTTADTRQTLHSKSREFSRLLSALPRPPWAAAIFSAAIDRFAGALSARSHAA